MNEEDTLSELRQEFTCPDYCGISCVDGSCPFADVDHPAHEMQCSECWRYRGCQDCAFAGTEMCKKGVPASGESV